MTSLECFHGRLLAHFGPQHWWPVSDRRHGEAAAWEIAAGAVLTQNTNWQNVEKALARLIGAGKLDARAIAGLDNPQLAELIRPAGYFSVKAKRLKALAEWWLESYSRAADPTTPLEDLREDLLAVYGIGPETADSILLYAFKRPTFVIDAYTKRVLTRHDLISDSASYDEMKDLFENALPRDPALFNEFHALLVAAGKSYCRPQPRCTNCPLAEYLSNTGR